MYVKIFMEISIYTAQLVTNCFNKSVLSVVFVISLNQLSSDWDSRIANPHHQINFHDAFNAYLPATARN